MKSQFVKKDAALIYSKLRSLICHILPHLSAKLTAKKGQQLMKILSLLDILSEAARGKCINLRLLYCLCNMACPVVCVRQLNR